MYVGQKRRLEIKKGITDLVLNRDKKQNKIQKLSAKVITLSNEINSLEQEDKLLSRIQNDPLVSSLSTLLILPIIQICQSFNTCRICEYCDIYHRIGFCPKECLSPIRKHEIKYRFNSMLIACDTNYRKQKTIPIVFYDENDNELWK